LWRGSTGANPKGCTQVGENRGSKKSNPIIKSGRTPGNERQKNKEKCARPSNKAHQYRKAGSAQRICRENVLKESSTGPTYDAETMYAAGRERF